MKITLISPYHGGSHRAWAEGFARASDHDVALLTLPDRFWKWRMHGGAVTLARRFLAQEAATDVLLATDMLDLSTFLALTRPTSAEIPTILYMHENQLTYPLPNDGSTGPMRRQRGERDHHYTFINYASMLAADAIWFNSSYHRASWFDALPLFLKGFPEYNELGSVAALEAKSEVVPVGIDLYRLDAVASHEPNAIPLILWNQRWEYDKNPTGFFEAMFALAERDVAFRLAVCGQQFGRRPAIFDEAEQRLADQIVHFGFAEGEQYRRLLWEADVVVSTAEHEFFGISVVEAMYAKTLPLLPNRLSYPELLPEPFHADCLYHSAEDLVAKLQAILTNSAEMRERSRILAQTLAQETTRYDWSVQAPRYDAALAAIGQKKSAPSARFS